MSSRARTTLVVGGGIAGLAAAWQLARRGRDVTLLEQESAYATHSSARNAQIWLPTDDDGSTGPLARRSATMFTELVGSEEAWLVRSGALSVIDDEAFAAGVERGATLGGLRARRLSATEARSMSPALVGLEGRISLFIEGAGIFDPSRMTDALARAARAAGAALRTDCGVSRIDVDDRRVRGVVLEDGERLAADEVINAAGAWAGALGDAIGAPTGLTPLRRHLVLLDADPALAGTTVWSFGPREVYYRPESGRVLASPCDEEPYAPCLPISSTDALEPLLAALADVAPALTDAPIRTSWACLRTYTPDRELVLGPDPRVPGLGWLAGFGGRGMTVALAAAELAAALMDGELTDVDTSALAAPMRPDRALSSW